MTTEEDTVIFDLGEEKKRGAIIVGINEYDDPKIPKLIGAENDAKDIAQILRKYGNFEIKDDYNLLINKQATNKNIRTAINDLLCDTSDPYDLIIFYFSGHGFSDKFNNGYIAPFDMMGEKPFITGISMKELNRVISAFSSPGTSSTNSKSAFLILDCCHSGIIIQEGNKGGTNLQDGFVKSIEVTVEESKAQGICMMASSQADQVSREIINFPHLEHWNATNPHPHGIFTSCLIKGLESEAADEHGTITSNLLFGYVDRETRTALQKPHLSLSGNQISAIKIAISSPKYQEHFTSEVAGCRKIFSTTNMASLRDCADKLQLLKCYRAEDRKIVNDFKQDIVTALKNYETKITTWYRNNSLNLRNQITVYANTHNLKEDPGLELLYKIRELEKYLALNEFIKMDIPTKQLITAVCDRITSNEKRKIITNSTEELTFLIEDCIIYIGGQSASESVGSQKLD